MFVHIRGAEIAGIEGTLIEPADEEACYVLPHLTERYGEGRITLELPPIA